MKTRRLPNKIQNEYLEVHLFDSQQQIHIQEGMKQSKKVSKSVMLIRY